MLVLLRVRVRALMLVLALPLPWLHDSAVLPGLHWAALPFHKAWLQAAHQTAPPCPFRRHLQLDPGLWEVCLQDYGIYRSSNICGKYLTV